MNNSINKNQLFDCYYTVDPSAFDENGCPKHEFEPKFGLPSCVFGGDIIEGSFGGKIKKVECKYSREKVYYFFELKC